MVFSTTNLFKSIACPQSEHCKLTNCIYGHPSQPQAAETSTSAASATMTPEAAASAASSSHASSQSQSNESSEPAHKRRKVTYESLAEKPLSRAEKIKADLEATRSGKEATQKVSPAPDPKPASSETDSAYTPASLSKPVSPPSGGGLKPPSKQTNAMCAPVNAQKDGAKASVTEPLKHTPAKKETLNPRLLSSAPESHSKRTLFLQHLHKDMMRLNNELKSATQPIQNLNPDQLKVFTLQDYEVIKLALDEEEKAATEQPKVYANVIKNRIAAYRKMKPETFLDIVKVSFGKEVAKPPVKKEGKTIDTGLSAAEEVKVAQHLTVPDQKVLIPHGYIPNPPTAAEAEEAAKAVQQSMNYEECDRCGSRFRVFPDRNDEGKLTTNGPCRHHPNKKVFPTKQKTDHYTGGHQPFYPCCMEQVGSPGCTASDDHVFKTSNPPRLASVLPFITTPENPNPAKDSKGNVVGAVAFDCEMGYTALGLELIRITAISWPENEPLLDVLVRPLGTIIDLSSRFSGVFPEHFANAIPYASWTAPNATQPTDPNATPPPLPIVDNPAAARSLLCSFLTPSTPLIGHAIENDLNATRLCHPSIIDTMLLYPHPRGLPFRYGLKMLAKKYLERDVQTGGDRGHDSLEDAVATGDLVRARVARQWRDLKGKGWKFIDGELVGPGGGGAGNMLEQAKAKGFNGGKKRPKRESEESGGKSVSEGEKGGEGLSAEFLEGQ